TKAPSTSRTVSRATWIPRRICATGRPSGLGTGSARVTAAPARAAATAPSGSNETTTTGSAPPDHAESTIRRTRGTPSASARADLGLAARITAATVTRPIVAARSDQDHRVAARVAARGKRGQRHLAGDREARLKVVHANESSIPHGVGENEHQPIDA